MKRSTYRRTVREGDRGEPQRPWVAWLEPKEGFPRSAWKAGRARVVDNAAAVELALRELGCPVARFTSQSKADAWLDDQKSFCSCRGGRGRFRCDSCQQGLLVGQLERSVHGDAGCCR